MRLTNKNNFAHSKSLRLFSGCIHAESLKKFLDGFKLDYKKRQVSSTFFDIICDYILLIPFLGLIGFISAVYHLRRNEALVSNIPKLLDYKICKLKADKLLRNKARPENYPFVALELENYCKSSISRSVFFSVFRPALLCTLSIALSLLVLPQIFLFTSTLAIVLYALGGIVLLFGPILLFFIASYFSDNSKLIVASELDKAATQEIIHNKLVELNGTEQRKMSDLPRASGLKNSLADIKFFLKFNKFLLITGGFFILDLVFALPIFSCFCILSTVIFVALHHKARRAKLVNLDEEFFKTIADEVNARTLGFFGSTALEKYIEKNRAALAAALKLNRSASSAQIAEELMQHHNIFLLAALVCSVYRESLLAGKDGPVLEHQLDSSIVKSRSNREFSDVLLTGLYHGFWLSLGLLGILNFCGFGLTVLLVSFSVGFGVSGVISGFVAHHERMLCLDIFRGVMGHQDISSNARRFIASNNLSLICRRDICSFMNQAPSYISECASQPQELTSVEPAVALSSVADVAVQGL
ncbi:hypothetical protein RLOatenuis_8750 [Rickettsiales bacterium]|nr:hypothetical protein RLOatenuis_8750 [Rickettsiales bacterium]